VLRSASVDFFHADALPRALLGTFIFGIVTAEGMMQNLTPPQVHALALGVFIDSLTYEMVFASQAVQECINATTPGYHDTMNAIIHRGIDAHRQLQEDDIAGLSKNINGILSHFQPRT
jgi:immunity protein 48 of polymorphic toxin system